MTHEEANRLAFAAVHRVIAAAHPFELTVHGRPVRVSITGQEATDWPAQAPGLSEAADGPWPPRVTARCEWDGGRVDLQVLAHAGRGKRWVVLALRYFPSNTALGFSNVSRALMRTDELEAPIVTWFNLKKRSAGDLQKKGNRKLRAIVAESNLPMSGRAGVELFKLKRDDGSMEPSPEEAFKRLVHINLIKLDFFSRGRRADARGRPLIDLNALGLDGAIEPIEEGEEELDDNEDAEDRRYWAGGFASQEQLRRYCESNAWEIGAPRDEEIKGVHKAWSLFERISPGDWLAIKSFGGSNELEIHYLGEVQTTDTERGRLGLRPIRRSAYYKASAPRGSEEGSWLDRLVEITRDDVIQDIFGVERDAQPAHAWTGPRNLILYGPPGTGKTYRLHSDIRPKFIEPGATPANDVEAIAELTWFQVIALALAEVGGEATAMELREHPFVKGKYQTKGHKAPIGSRVWATLQSHTIEASEHVDYARRHGRLVFDKRPDGRWHFPEGVPDEVHELLRAIRPASGDGAEHFVFVTFHQSYTYEDFIEGIRPKTDLDGDGAGTLTYELEDGVFMRAAHAAVRLAGFDGTVDELCRRPREERARLFDHAPPYGVFIDEINRGNVSRIFGELISLIEEDKRLGAPGELIVTLPYSRRRFGVPKNLCLIGTMNTADRSVEALDTALRRRFAFEECPPNPAVLGDVKVEGGIDVTRMLRTINARLERLIDRDHLIGHAYFEPLRDDPSIDCLKEVFQLNILPLLTEYFYADLGRIGLVLGRDFVQPIERSVQFASFPHDAADQLASRPAYRLRDVESVTTASFRAIYEENGA